MKKILFTLAIILCVASCEYDDTEIRESIDSIEQRLSAVEKVQNAYKNNLFIKTITKIQNGYEIVFSDGSTATILNGTDGKDGDVLIKSITVGEGEVTFVLSNGCTFLIPLYNFLSITFDSEDLVAMTKNSTRKINYTINSQIPDVSIEVVSSTDIQAKVVGANGFTGTIEITTGETINEYSKVVVFVSNGEKVIMRSIYFEEAELKVVWDWQREISVEGGYEELEYMSNIECDVVIPEDAKSWISVVPTTRTLETHTIRLKIEPNTGKSRTAEVLIESVDRKLSLAYTINQWPTAEYQHKLERDALVAIYNALDGDNWNNNTNWCSDKPVTEWYGVSCDTRNGFVSNLDLRGNNLSGVIPEDIGKLEFLTNLYFEDVGITDISDAIYNLRRLHYLILRLSQCKISHKINNLRYLNSLSLAGDIELPSNLNGLIYLKDLSVYRSNNNSMDAVCDIKSLEWLDISHHNNLHIPHNIGNLSSLKQLYITDSKIEGQIPSSIGDLKNLKTLDLSFNTIESEVPTEIGELIGLEFLNLYNSTFTGNLPASLGNLINLWYFNIGWNEKLIGNLSQKIADLPICKQMWPDFYNHTGYLNPSHCVFDAPDFIVNDLNDNTINSEDLYKNHKLIVFFIWNGFCSFTDQYTQQIMKLYEKYKGDDDVCILGYANSDSTIETVDEAKQFVLKQGFPWQNIFSDVNNDYSGYNNRIIEYSVSPVVIVFDTNKKVVFHTYKNSLQHLESFIQICLHGDNHHYTSTDYSIDGKLTTLQKATKGNGLDVVLMGDGYSDRQIADGTYASVMQSAYENFFSVEPYKSHKELFNVYYVTAVSATEGYEYNNTALSGYFGDGTYVGGDDITAINYALNAVDESRLDNTNIVVMMNSNRYAGTCYSYYPSSTNDYGSGLSISYFPVGTDATQFEQLLHHEACGHGFAKLADEYAYEYMGTVSADYVSQIQWQQRDFGWWKNVDFTSDPTAVLWAKFITDSRYLAEGIGVFEGGLTYWSGVWRPTENSIMRVNTGEFNAPSREAIYYRIHKLAYGNNWTYDYEKFVEYDTINRKTDTQQSVLQPMVLRPLEPTAPPVIVNKNWRDILKRK